FAIDAAPRQRLQRFGATDGEAAFHRVRAPRAGTVGDAGPRVLPAMHAERVVGDGNPRPGVVALRRNVDSRFALVRAGGAWKPASMLSHSRRCRVILNSLLEVPVGVVQRIHEGNEADRFVEQEVRGRGGRAEVDGELGAAGAVGDGPGDGADLRRWRGHRPGHGGTPRPSGTLSPNLNRWTTGT